MKDQSLKTVKTVRQPCHFSQKAAEDCAHSKTLRANRDRNELRQVLECAQSSAAFEALACHCRRRLTSAFSLIEVIGVLAVTLILMLAFAWTTVKSMDVAYN